MEKAPTAIPLLGLLVLPSSATRADVNQCININVDNVSDLEVSAWRAKEPPEPHLSRSSGVGVPEAERSRESQAAPGASRPDQPQAPQRGRGAEGAGSVAARLSPDPEVGIERAGRGNASIAPWAGGPYLVDGQRNGRAVAQVARGACHRYGVAAGRCAGW